MHDSEHHRVPVRHAGWSPSWKVSAAPQRCPSPAFESPAPRRKGGGGGWRHTETGVLTRTLIPNGVRQQSAWPTLYAHSGFSSIYFFLSAPRSHPPALLLLGLHPLCLLPSPPFPSPTYWFDSMLPLLSAKVSRPCPYPTRNCRSKTHHTFQICLDKICYMSYPGRASLPSSPRPAPAPHHPLLLPPSSLHGPPPLPVPPPRTHLLV